MQSRILSLPLYPEMTDEQFDAVVRAVHEFGPLYVRPRSAKARSNRSMCASKEWSWKFLLRVGGFQVRRLRFLDHLRGRSR